MIDAFQEKFLFYCESPSHDQKDLRALVMYTLQYQIPAIDFFQKTNTEDYLPLTKHQICATFPKKSAFQKKSRGGAFWHFFGYLFPSNDSTCGWFDFIRGNCGKTKTDDPASGSSPKNKSQDADSMQAVAGLLSSATSAANAVLDHVLNITDASQKRIRAMFGFVNEQLRELDQRTTAISAGVMAVSIFLFFMDKKHIKRWFSEITAIQRNDQKKIKDQNPSWLKEQDLKSSTRLESFTKVLLTNYSDVPALVLFSPDGSLRSLKDAQKAFLVYYNHPKKPGGKNTKKIRSPIISNGLTKTKSRTLRSRFFK